MLKTNAKPSISLALFLLVASLLARADENIDKQFVDALRHGDCDSVSSLLEQQLIDSNKILAKSSLLSLASMRGDICIMQALLRFGANINDADGKSGPIIGAYMAKKYDAVKLLIEEGATVPNLLNTFAAIETAKGNTAAAEALGLDIEQKKKPQQARPDPDASEITVPDVYSGPGYYTGPCTAKVEDSAPGHTKPGDTGNSVLIYTVFKDVARGPVHVKEVMIPECKPVYLDSPHGYSITTKIFLDDWTWICSGTADEIRLHCPYLSKKSNGADYYEMTSLLKRPDTKGDCEKDKALEKVDNEIAPSPDLAGTAAEPLVNDALIASLKQFNKSASSEFTRVYYDRVTRFLLRISPDDCLLPNLDLLNEAIKNNCVKPHSLDGAHRTILGSVQQANGQTRVITKLVDVETGIIVESGKGDATGTDRDAVENATNSAFDKMGFKPSCAKPMKNDLSEETDAVNTL